MMIEDLETYLNKHVAIEFSGENEIVGTVLTVSDDEIEVQLLGSDEVVEISIQEVDDISVLQSMVKKASESPRVQSPFVEVHGKKKRRKKPPKGASWSRKDPTEGGCWFCHIQDDELVFDSESDTYVHIECISNALEEDPKHPEALLMKYLLE